MTHCGAGVNRPSEGSGSSVTGTRKLRRPGNMHAQALHFQGKRFQAIEQGALAVVLCRGRAALDVEGAVGLEDAAGYSERLSKPCDGRRRAVLPRREAPF
jgi:hypothetical protein